MVMVRVKNLGWEVLLILLVAVELSPLVLANPQGGTPPPHLSLVTSTTCHIIPPEAYVS